MGFRDPITTAEDPVARQDASDALAAANSRNRVYGPSSAPPTAPAGGFVTGDQWIKSLTGGGVALNVWTGSAWAQQQFGAGTLAAGTVVAGTVAAGAIDGMTITGVTLRTGADGTPRVRIYEGIDGKGSPMGFLAFEDGIQGDDPGTITGEAYAIGGGGMSLSGGTYAGKAAASINLQTDGSAPELDLTASGGAIFANGGKLNVAARAWNLPRSASTNNASDSFGAGSMIALVGGTITNAPPGDYLITDTLTLSASVTTVAYHRLVVGGANVTGDSRIDLNGSPAPRTFTYCLLGFAGGNLGIQASAQVGSGTGTVFTAGSNIAVAYLGPRNP